MTVYVDLIGGVKPDLKRRLVEVDERREIGMTTDPEMRLIDLLVQFVMLPAGLVDCGSRLVSVVTRVPHAPLQRNC